jgi:hypothetical protein
MEEDLGEKNCMLTRAKQRRDDLIALKAIKKLKNDRNAGEDPQPATQGSKQGKI